MHIGLAAVGINELKEISSNRIYDILRNLDKSELAYLKCLQFP